MYEIVLYIAVAIENDVSLIMVTRIVSIYIFRMECFKAVTFDTGYEKSMSFFTPKSPRVCKTSEKVAPDSLSFLL